VAAVLNGLEKSTAEGDSPVRTVKTNPPEEPKPMLCQGGGRCSMGVVGPDIPNCRAGGKLPI
jgi:hypothetical protein